jgi:hypothetical protein
VNIQLHPELRDSMGSNSNASFITFGKNMKLDPELINFMACECNTSKITVRTNIIPAAFNSCMIHDHRSRNFLPAAFIWRWE